MRSGAHRSTTKEKGIVSHCHKTSGTGDAINVATGREGTTQGGHTEEQRVIEAHFTTKILGGQKNESNVGRGYGKWWGRELETVVCTITSE